MARLRKNDTTVNTAPAAAAGAAAPARHRAATPRKRSAAKSTANVNEAPVESAAELIAEIAGTPVEIIETVSATGVAQTAIAAEPQIEMASYTPSHEEISVLAYSYWVERNYAPGSPELDWLRAEAELRQRASAA